MCYAGSWASEYPDSRHESGEGDGMNNYETIGIVLVVVGRREHA